MGHENESQERLTRALDFLGLDRSCSRRGFLKLSGVTVVGSQPRCNGAKAGKEMP